MKFEFCGQNECPEWVLAESALLSKVSAIKLKLICAQIIKRIIKDPSYEEAKIYRLCSDCKLTQEEGFCIISILDYIIHSAAKFNVDQEIFSKEIAHLGIPIENVSVIVKIYVDKAKDLRVVKHESLQISTLKDTHIKISHILASSIVGDKEYEPGETREPIGVQINMGLEIEEFPNEPKSKSTRIHNFAVSYDKLAALTSELDNALEMMKEE
uniref:COMM domain-containing protein 4 n=1 Tax=Euplotes crassus TaxID=5936 RepID=A0A7S3K6T4_EUPCR|mmetsp:Transcript_12495/g.12538  ORF Transcript_12495/g.12538 Transcript_12495/m.12538 type:complete len:213 (+) Transcript_12495:3-641(+)